MAIMKFASLLAKFLGMWNVVTTLEKEVVLVNDRVCPPSKL